jgi:hypothetical protein
MIDVSAFRNLLFLREAGIGGRIHNVNFTRSESGAGDGNRTHVRSLGSYAEHIEAFELAAFLRFSIFSNGFQLEQRGP